MQKYISLHRVTQSFRAIFSSHYSQKTHDWVLNIILTRCALNLIHVTLKPEHYVPEAAGIQLNGA